MDELLRIDPEFESKIPPLTEEEYQLLEENILLDGVVLNPLIVWNGCIVDGHNRFRIGCGPSCRPGLPRTWQLPQPAESLLRC